MNPTTVHCTVSLLFFIFSAGTVEEEKEKYKEGGKAAKDLEIAESDQPL